MRQKHQKRSCPKRSRVLHSKTTISVNFRHFLGEAPENRVNPEFQQDHFVRLKVVGEPFQRPQNASETTTELIRYSNTFRTFQKKFAQNGPGVSDQNSKSTPSNIPKNRVCSPLHGSGGKYPPRLRYRCTEAENHNASDHN